MLSTPSKASLAAGVALGAALSVAVPSALRRLFGPAGPRLRSTALEGCCGRSNNSLPAQSCQGCDCGTVASQYSLADELLVDRNSHPSEPSIPGLEIHYLGHAGFLVETETCLVVIDPWLSVSGAFDASWYQLPRNHHLAPFVISAIEFAASAGKQVFVYISHEHQDHFDIDFLRTLPWTNISAIIPDFRRTFLKDAIAELGPRKLITVQDSEKVALEDGKGYIQIFLQDTELSRDSAIFIEYQGTAGPVTFLNMNDCNIHDRIPDLFGGRTVDVLTTQFSGAMWYPVCYRYDAANYENICRQVYTNKFASVCKLFQQLRPRVFLPSAGPVAFLDPETLDVNFHQISIFPKSWDFKEYVAAEVPEDVAPVFPTWMPGDVVSVDGREHTVSLTGSERVDAKSFTSYVKKYAADLRPAFEMRRRKDDLYSEALVLRKLFSVLSERVSKVRGVFHDIETTMYWAITGYAAEFIEVHWDKNTVSIVQSIDRNRPFYILSCPKGQLGRLLERKLKWGEFVLTMRQQLERQPDVFQTPVSGFLRTEDEDLEALCDTLDSLNKAAQARTTITLSNGTKYEINRYCPHQGADLSNAEVKNDRFLVCPRHGWQFDLQQDGKGVNNNGSVRAVRQQQAGPSL